MHKVFCIFVKHNAATSGLDSTRIICCHLLSLVVICYHSLPLAVIRCTSRYYSLSRDVSLVCLMNHIMIVSINSQQMRCQNSYWEDYLVFFFVCIWKKRNHSTMRILRIVKETILRSSCYATLAWYQFKDTLLSHHSLNNFFICCCNHVSSFKKMFFFSFKRDELRLRALHMRMNIYFGLLCKVDALT